MAEPKLQRMSAEEFLAWQEKQELLYELVDGIPVLPLKMMTGASQRHDRAVINIIAALHRQLRGGPCRPTTDDLAVRIPAGNLCRPDMTVECGRPKDRDMLVHEPRVVIEVLSPSTMSFDRFKKLAEYQTIPTLSHILLVDTEAPRVDVLARSGTGTGTGVWTSARHEGLGASIDLPTIAAALDLAEIFEGIAFED